MIGLRKKCTHQASAPKGPEPSKGAKYRLGRFLKGRHPTRDVALEGPFRTLPSELAWRPVWPPRPGEGGVSTSAASALPGFSDAGSWEPELPPEGEDPWPEGPPDFDEFCLGV